MKLPQLMKRERSVLALAACAATLLVSGTLHAGTVATDNAVPASMDTEGTSGNHSIYIIGSGTAATTGTVTHSAATNVGNTKPYVDLIIQNGWTLISQTNSNIGNFYVSDIASDRSRNNSVTVTGTGSTWELVATGSPTTLSVGRVGYNNSLIVQNGGKVKATNSYLRMGTAGARDNSLLIETGGRVAARAISIGHATSGTFVPNNNQITVNGSNSSLISNEDLVIGKSGTGNRLTIEEGGLVVVSHTNYHVTLSPNALTINAGNYLRLDGGYLAIKAAEATVDALLATLLSGSQETSRIQIWDANTQTWVGATAGSIVTNYYSTREAALAAIGYSSTMQATIVPDMVQGGYTIISAIPEAGTVGLLLIGLGSLVYFRRRKGL